ncbi:MAG: MerR family transcriptional regulator [bacterium]|nr:hypothetical protein [Deltaproteobacteria bacterium]MCP4903728.1 MerR family transcriptional regulator [bacterium]
MRIPELGRRAGVPATTITYYVRERLIPTGQRNQATYYENRLQRLELIRALREVAHLPLEVVREVLDQLDKPWGEGDPIGAAMDAIYRVPDRDRNAAKREEFEAICGEVDELMRGLDWVLSEATDVSHHLNVEVLADAIAQMRRYIEPNFPVERLRGYAAAAWHFAEAAHASMEDRVPLPGDDLVDATGTATLGTLILEPSMMSLVHSALAIRSVHISNGVPLPPVS